MEFVFIVDDGFDCGDVIVILDYGYIDVWIGCVFECVCFVFVEVCV